MAFTDTLFLGVGDYSAAQDRFMTLFDMAEGVAPVKGGDPRLALEVTTNPNGANMQVRIRSGWALVEGDDATNQGNYADYNAADLFITNTLGAPASQPRVDMVVARVNDSEHTVRVPANAMYCEFIYGSPTAGASLTNRLGAAALPPTALHLADVLLSPGNTSIGASQIGDQRRIAGPMIYAENGNRYRLGIDAQGRLGLEQL